MARSQPGSVFLCWSGARSLKLATRFKQFLVDVVPPLRGRVFDSPQIEKGARWFEEVLRQLESARAGVICMTAENMNAPWLHFESGALLRGLHAATAGAGRPNASRNRVFTYLHGVTPASLSGPLSQYQSTSTTCDDTRSLVSALAQALDLEIFSRKRFDTHWPAFERDLKAIHVTVPELLPDFESRFKRKTFEEAVEDCADQNWIGRYDGARETHDALKARQAAVRLACPKYQADLYDRLLQLLDAYSMAIRGLLLRAPDFVLRDNGTLDIVPAGTRAACEDRRSRIKDIVSRILDPMSVPETEGAAAFWLADSFDERKMLVHRCEFAVLGGRGRRRRAHAAAPSARRARELFESVWELDRIFGYLATEYLHARTDEALEAVWRASIIELERARAQAKPRLMALHYALGALHAALACRGPAARRRVRTEVLDLSARVRALIDSSKPAPEPKGRRRKTAGDKSSAARPALDAGGQVRRTLHDIDRLLMPSRRSR